MNGGTRAPAQADRTRPQRRASQLRERPGLRVLDPTARLIRHDELPIVVADDEGVCDHLSKHLDLQPHQARYRLVEIEIALLNPSNVLSDEEMIAAGYTRDRDRWEYWDNDRSRAMMAVLDDLPAPIVYDLGSEIGWVIFDGFHRVAAHNACGRKRIVCYELINDRPR